MVTNVELPARKALLEILNASDPLIQILRGHQAIDAALCAGIGEALAEPHALEITRMSFELKLDLAVALGVLRPEAWPAFRSINRIRNAFAHRSDAIIDERVTRDLFASLAPHHREILRHGEEGKDSIPSDVRHVIAVLFFEARAAYFRLRDGKLVNETLAELIRETLASRPETPSVRFHEAEVARELRDMVAKKKRERDLPK